MNTGYYLSPIGLLKIVEEKNTIREITFLDEEVKQAHHELHGALAVCIQQLKEYFELGRKEFDLTLAPNGTTFQRKVWKELERIPFGKTVSYMDMAKRLEDPKVIRAAATANGKNPIAIIIPCHRVVGSDGSLTGYAGGLKRKQWLLEHESSQRTLFSENLI